MSTINKEVKKEVIRLQEKTPASNKKKSYQIRKAIISLVEDAIKKDDTSTLINILPSLRRM